MYDRLGVLNDDETVDMLVEERGRLPVTTEAAGRVCEENESLAGAAAAVAVVWLAASPSPSDIEAGRSAAFPKNRAMGWIFWISDQRDGLDRQRD